MSSTHALIGCLVFSVVSHICVSLLIPLTCLYACVSISLFLSLSLSSLSLSLSLSPFPLSLLPFFSLSCKRCSERVSEAKYPVLGQEEYGTPVVLGRIKRIKSMQPKPFEEQVARLLGTHQRNRRERERMKKRP